MQWCSLSLSQLGTGRERLVPVGSMILPGFSPINRDAFQESPNRQAYRTDQDAQDPQLPAEWHRTSKSPQELYYDCLEGNRGSDHEQEYPAAQHATQYVELLYVPAIYFIEHLKRKPG